MRRATSTAILRCPTGDSSVWRPARRRESRNPANSGRGPALGAAMKPWSSRDMCMMGSSSPGMESSAAGSASACTHSPPGARLRSPTHTTSGPLRTRTGFARISGHAVSVDSNTLRESTRAALLRRVCAPSAGAVAAESRGLPRLVLLHRRRGGGGVHPQTGAVGEGSHQPQNLHRRICNRRLISGREAIRSRSYRRGRRSERRLETTRVIFPSMRGGPGSVPGICSPPVYDRFPHRESALLPCTIGSHTGEHPRPLRRVASPN
eukprot:9065236-Pyramimonas_sp.AAC.2